MRYYSLRLSNSAGQVYSVAPTGGLYLTGAPATDSSGVPAVTVGGRGIQSKVAQWTFTSHPQGLFAPPDPGALDIAFDFAVYQQHTPQGGAVIKVSGVGLQAIGQAADLNGARLQLYGGMGLGIGGANGLANPRQAGLLIDGEVFNAYGNWEGTSQVLMLVAQPPNLDPPGGITFTWAPGQPLGSALYLALNQAFGGKYVPRINIAPLMTKYGETQQGMYQNLRQFASALNKYTRALGDQTPLKDDYPGVSLSVAGNMITASDATLDTTPPIALAFTDLVGQPTWLGSAQISFKTVLRSDIQVGSRVTFPAGIFTPYAVTSPAAALPGSPARSRTVFQGTFTVIECHHFADFRNPSADAWVTAYAAVPNIVVPSA